ncbi:tetratricopeptide repeat protein 31 [Caerostris darwini]|uniref:Tetratricopeptide repeat protein 31 n=1 Tax=Caerostris darwini TaxID=1538125 RepID=A0AAV4P270_9ARAC|nr:tetratricopeptide repeat protein 31 [Caerostris darwini]
MLPSKDIALDILGLPSFATVNEIVLRYKVLSLMWFPENHHNHEFALQEFGNISEAAVKLIFPEKSIGRKLTLLSNMVAIKGIKSRNIAKYKDKDCDYASDESEASICEELNAELEAQEIQADDNAAELIIEEEREKNKAEKRRAKKKKRKERKKLEKLEKETNTENVDSSNSGATKPKKVQDVKISESEEDLDTSSAFVSVIARKQKKGADIEAKKEEPPIRRPSIPKEDPESIIMRSRELALRGNELANMCYYSEAAEFFTESIKLDPSDHRFYGNRSYCYDRMGLYEKALKDAEKSIALSPVWPKGYFRKGRALLGLKKFAVAEQCFVEVMKLDNDCEEAISELRKAKILQIMEKGYSKEHAEAAISSHGTVTEALSGLIATGVARVPVSDITDIFLSDDEADHTWKAVQRPKPVQPAYDIKMDPNNPEGHNSLWIGNVQADVTEKKLSQLFGKYGELLSVKVMPEKFCAFVNYKQKTSPGKAMKAYQGYELSGFKLVIRFPNLPGESVVKKKPVVAAAAAATATATVTASASASNTDKRTGPVNGNECYFWRTTGCTHGDQCRYKHIRQHKGIDKKNWQGL